MTGIGVQGNISNDAKLRHCLTKCAHYSWNESIGVERLLGVRRLAAGIDNREQRESTDTESIKSFGPLQQKIQADSFHAGHGRNGFADRRALADKDRLNQIINAECALPHQRAAKSVFAQTPHP